MDQNWPKFTKIDLKITIINNKYEIILLHIIYWTVALKKFVGHAINLAIALTNLLKNN